VAFEVTIISICSQVSRKSGKISVRRSLPGGVSIAGRPEYEAAALTVQRQRGAFLLQAVSVGMYDLCRCYPQASIPCCYRKANVLGRSLSQRSHASRGARLPDRLLPSTRPAARRSRGVSRAWRPPGGELPQYTSSTRTDHAGCGPLRGSRYDRKFPVSKGMEGGGMAYFKVRSMSNKDLKSR
jgi:hypothetical protein